MLVINRNSHLAKFMADGFIGSGAWKPLPTSLCKFVRRFLFNVFVTAFVATVAVFEVLSMLFTVPAVLIYGIPDDDIGVLFAVFGGVGWMFIAGLGFWAVMGWITNRPVVERATRRAVNSTIGSQRAASMYKIVSTWIYAVHNKVCPTIDYTWRIPK